jgi:hypothetical protein
MIKATSRTRDGRTVLIIGLSFGNLDKFRAEPIDTFIQIDGKELDLPIDVVMFSGETEAQLLHALNATFGPGTKITIDKKLKQ